MNKKTGRLIRKPLVYRLQGLLKGPIELSISPVGHKGPCKLGQLSAVRSAFTGSNHMKKPLLPLYIRTYGQTFSTKLYIDSQIMGGSQPQERIQGPKDGEGAK
ncbi:hypothetical protein KQX54_009101 [Cotesia glomerata]|uniref:Uncharacterized protein n=1 Tax=Cotesia glomerata TaxID=32391 RepID=A0AAV7IAT8_COTGL|nr:hypothetical protein KQX54_009101 [Cotesia glomerata]